MAMQAEQKMIPNTKTEQQDIRISIENLYWHYRELIEATHPTEIDSDSRCALAKLCAYEVFSQELRKILEGEEYVAD